VFADWLYLHFVIALAAFAAVLAWFARPVDRARVDRPPVDRSRTRRS
jgi:hypothetical protein